MKNNITLAHGAGGKLTRDLIDKTIIRILQTNGSNTLLDVINDAASFSAKCDLAFTTDSYVVNPIFFPGGNIGTLAVSGTVNDLLSRGAIPKHLSLSLIIEDGLPIKDLDEILLSISNTCKMAGVSILTGDTKVVEHGKADKIFINTAGIGFIPKGRAVSTAGAKPGDTIIVSGTIGDHEVAILKTREELGFNVDIESDCAPLNDMLECVFEALGKDSIGLHTIKDPTRGGLAGALYEVASNCNILVEIQEALVPIKVECISTSELFGLDPLYMANEGKLVIFCKDNVAETIVSALKKHTLGKNAAIIGKVTSPKTPGVVLLNTLSRGKRILPMLSGLQVPRIC